MSSGRCIKVPTPCSSNYVRRWRNAVVYRKRKEVPYLGMYVAAERAGTAHNGQACQRIPAVQLMCACMTKLLPTPSSDTSKAWAVLLRPRSDLHLAYRQASELHAQRREVAEREMRGPGTAAMGLALALCYILTTSALGRETAHSRGEKGNEDFDLGDFDFNEQERRWQACP